MGSFLHEEIGQHGTSDFCDRVLDGGLGPTDKGEINFTEAYKLLQHMERKKLSPKKQTPYQWIKDSISNLLRPSEDDDLDSDSDDKEPLPSDPLD